MGKNCSSKQWELLWASADTQNQRTWKQRKKLDRTSLFYCHCPKTQNWNWQWNVIDWLYIVIDWSININVASTYQLDSSPSLMSTGLSVAPCQWFFVWDSPPCLIHHAFWLATCHRHSRYQLGNITHSAIISPRKSHMLNIPDFRLEWSRCSTNWTRSVPQHTAGWLVTIILSNNIKRSKI